MRWVVREICEAMISEVARGTTGDYIGGNTMIRHRGVRRARH